MTNISILAKQNFYFYYWRKNYRRSNARDSVGFKSFVWKEEVTSISGSRNQIFLVKGTVELVSRLCFFTIIISILHCRILAGMYSILQEAWVCMFLIILVILSFFIFLHIFFSFFPWLACLASMTHWLAYCRYTLTVKSFRWFLIIGKLFVILQLYYTCWKATLKYYEAKKYSKSSSLWRPTVSNV